LHPELAATALSRREEEETTMDGLNGLSGLSGLSGLNQGLGAAFGLHTEPKDFTLLQVSLRSIVTYGAGLIILRLSRNRFLARESAFDVLLAFILGSVLSRAINGSSPFLLSIAATVLLVAIHQVLAWLSFRSPHLERLLDGTPGTIVRDGKLLEPTARHHLLSTPNITEALRLKAHLKELSQVEEARVEVNGEISFIPRRPPPRIVEVRVEQGVQVVRLEIS
jgi:uncharacterized membrane protein YcaP (DUF421 family)